jgi:hypothetical protein
MGLGQIKIQGVGHIERGGVKVGAAFNSLPPTWQQIVEKALRNLQWDLAKFDEWHANPANAAKLKQVMDDPSGKSLATKISDMTTLLQFGRMPKPGST